MSLVMLCSYRDPIDAELAKAHLESAGIPAVILDRHLVAIQWLYSNAIGGVKIAVDQDDLESARQILSEDHSTELLNVSESQSPPADGDVCPICTSSAIHPSRLQRIAAAGSLATGVPLVMWRRRWICSSCGHSWRPLTSGKPILAVETLRAEEVVHERRSYRVLIGAIVFLLALGVLSYLQTKLRQPL
jgi:hypothetical protein